MSIETYKLDSGINIGVTFCDAHSHIKNVTVLNINNPGEKYPHAMTEAVEVLSKLHNNLINERIESTSLLIAVCNTLACAEAVAKTGDAAIVGRLCAAIHDTIVEHLQKIGFDI